MKRRPRWAGGANAIPPKTPIGCLCVVAERKLVSVGFRLCTRPSSHIARSLKASLPRRFTTDCSNSRSLLFMAEIAVFWHLGGGSHIEMRQERDTLARFADERLLGGGASAQPHAAGDPRACLPVRRRSSGRDLDDGERLPRQERRTGDLENLTRPWCRRSTTC